MPEGLDPDDVAKQGAAAYQKCLDAAMPLIDYKIHAVERKYDLSRSEEKRKFVLEALKVVAEAESESVQEELLKKLRDQTKITYHALERDLERVKKEKPSTETNEPELQEQTRIAETATGTDKSVKAVRFILAAKLFDAPYAKDYDVKELPLSDSSHKEIAAFILERERAGERMRAHELFEILDEDDLELSAICDFNFEDKLTGETAERFFRDSVKTLKKQALEREIAQLNEAFSAETDEEKRKAIGRKIMDCVKQANQLKK
jgi:DNA primase